MDSSSPTKKPLAISEAEFAKMRTDLVAGVRETVAQNPPAEPLPPGDGVLFNPAWQDDPADFAG